MAILAVNAGSSSLKFSLHDIRAGEPSRRIFSGMAEGLEPGGQARCAWTHLGQKRECTLAGNDTHGFDSALQHLTALLGAPDMPVLEAIAHRVVHGGSQYRASVLVCNKVLNDLSRLASLAPLHQKHNLAGIGEFSRHFPDLPQVACFDTAFHASLPDNAHSFALPRALADQGVRRYGFHGLSYQFIINSLERHGAKAHGKVVMAHLGNGASLCATFNKLSQATTMGFTALDGLMMGSRSGSIDAGILLWLMEQGWDHDRLQDLLYRQSGLLGVSGISADMRQLRADDSPQARQAIEQFTYRVVRETGAMTACLGGLDVLAFSGGIGEHDSLLREEVCEGMNYLGVRIDKTANQLVTGDSVRAIHRHDSKVAIWVVPTDEGSVAAEEAAVFLSRSGQSGSATTRVAKG